MRIFTTISLLGLSVVIIPFFGFPGSWKTFLFVLIGLTIAILSFLITLVERDRRTRRAYARVRRTQVRSIKSGSRNIRDEPKEDVEVNTSTNKEES